MDGISVAASIIGLLAAAAKISSTLNDFIVKVREAPKLARTVLLEIADISACLNQVQSLLLGVGSINASNQSLLMVNDLDVILSNCVVIFSELEELAEGLKPDQPIQAIDILKWTIKEKAITALLLRLQSSKTSLSLMISALTCSSIEDARGAVDQLTGIVRELLESNRDTYERLGRIESKNLETITISSRTTHDLVHESITEDDESAVTTRRLKTGSPPQNAHEIATSNYTFDFEQLLESSRPYVRASKRPQPPASATSSTIQTLGWSCLSGISLAKVSNISIIELTVDKEQLWNSTRYDSRHPVLGTLSEGGIVRIFSDIRSHFIFDLIRCQGCGRDQEPTENSWKRLEEPANIYAASFVTGSATGSPTSLANRNWWHIDCIRCTSCSASWDSKFFFYELNSLTCQDCLPDCFVCGFKSSMYHPGNVVGKVLCSVCISYGNPCTTCGHETWKRTPVGFLEGYCCLHYRVLLMQRGSYIKNIYNTLHKDLQKPLPAVPEKPREGAVKNGYPSINSNFIREFREGSKSEERHFLKYGTRVNKQLDSEYYRRKVTADSSAEELGDDWIMDENTYLCASKTNSVPAQAARKSSKGKDGGRPRPGSGFKPLLELKNGDERISSPVTAENSLGWN